MNVIAASRVWNAGIEKRIGATGSGACVLITSPEELSAAALQKYSPRYIFFPHWSHIIKPEIFGSHECVIFHMTDVPFGRGGSPLQNLIARGVYETQISALRCVKELDAGPVYLKRPLSLYGTAQEIYMRANAIIEEMIVEIINTNPVPHDQEGEPVIFKRRTPDEGNLAVLEGLAQVHDFIRMLDADGYPQAFLETKNLRFEFSRSSLKSDHILADVIIRRKPDGK